MPILVQVRATQQSARHHLLEDLQSDLLLQLSSLEFAQLPAASLQRLSAQELPLQEASLGDPS